MRTHPQTTTLIFVFLFIEACTSAGQVRGRYTNVFADLTVDELRFSQESNKFDYYSRTEGALKGYSLGTWKQNNRTIFLNGFNDKNINILDVESKVEDYSNENKDRIVVQYKNDPLDTFTKVDIVVNGGSGTRVSGDTTYFVDAIVKTLQVKSYLVHEGLLLGAPTYIDTLYSPGIEMGNLNGHKKILLSLNVAQRDFYRIKVTDTLFIKNRHTIIWRKKQFKKTREYEPR
ncbi:hypothetical protein PV783_21260 [Chitinophaga sp. CC14]|uniref:hypothetical protein n=1 Tax=Chitinophaga sp. CC14 TaxID=3029199 RepID=UPI003B76F8EE